MRLEEAIQKLDRSVSTTDARSSVKIRQRFSNILQEVKYKDLPQEQLSLLEQELELIFKDLDLNDKKADAELHLHLKKLLKFLRINFALIPEGYHAMCGMRIGLITGLILLLFLYFYTGSSYSYYIPLGGLLLGVMLGSLFDKRQKARGRSLLTRMV